VRVKYWEIIAYDLSKVGWSWGCVSAVDSRGEQSELLTRITATEHGYWWNHSRMDRARIILILN